MGRPEKILTIAVPNFNQDHLLERTLNQLSEIIGSALESKIEIIVGDNFSSDRSKQIISNLAPPIKTFRQVSNIGLQRHFWFLLQKSTSRWVTVIGSGELIDLESLPALILYLENLGDEVGVVVSDVASVSSFENRVKSPSTISPTHHRHTNIRPLNTSYAGNFLRRSAISQIGLEIMAPYHQGPWPHVALMLEMYAQGWEFRHYQHQVVYLDQSYGWWGRQEMYGYLLSLEKLYKHASMVQAGLPREFAVRQLIKNNKKNFLAWMVRGMLLGAKRPRSADLIDILKVCAGSPALLLGFLCIFLTPTFLLRILLRKRFGV